MNKNNFDIKIESISYIANCLLNNEITRAKSQIDVGIDNYEMGYYVGLLKAIQIIKGGQIGNRRMNMTKKEIIRNLKYTMEKHKNDRVDTFGTNISLMCKDILDYLEKEPCGKDINVPATDTISRQMAIDSLGECPMVWTDSDEEITAERDWKDTVEMLKSLPSVNPQPKTEVLDKIRAEIDTQEKWLSEAGYTVYNVDIAFSSIKRVIAESGDK